MTYKVFIKAVQALAINQSIDVPKEHLMEVNKVMPILNIFGRCKYVFNNDFTVITKLLKDEY